MLQGKRILLGVTGGIAAYKAATIVRLLVKEGTEVKIVMTAAAKNFITPLTLATLSKNPILVDFFNPENGEWNSHVSLGEWADAFVVAPATAASIAKMATGVADNLLITTYLSARCQVFVAPAMDLDMYKHNTTVRNISLLRDYGNIIIEPDSGELASGLIGKGRMAEPESIVKVLREFFGKSQNLAGYRVLVNAGATVERVDAVRYISNDSSGKMGYQVAHELENRGAEVVFVAGKTAISVDDLRAEIHHVESAAEMFEKCDQVFDSCHAAVFTAAVADYTPKVVLTHKMKKSADNFAIEMVPTVDIAKTLSQKKGTRITCGFALESDNEQANALSKLKSKNLNFIVLNSLNDEGAGFGHDTNKISILSDDNSRHDFGLKSKKEVAVDIVDQLEKYILSSQK